MTTPRNLTPRLTRREDRMSQAIILAILIFVGLMCAAVVAAGVVFL